MIEKYESRRIRVQIRHVLLDVWDPIGIKDEPSAQDEYDGYIGKVYELLVGRVPDDVIEDYLLWAVNNHMGLDAPRSAMKGTVAAMRRIQLPVDSA